MGYQDWERVEKELAEILPGVEYVGNPNLEELPCPDLMPSQLEPPSCPAEYTADTLLEHIARALEDGVIPPHE